MITESYVTFCNVIFLFQKPDDAVFKEWERMDPCDSLQGMYSPASSYFHIWEGLLCEDWAACEGFGMGRSLREHLLLAEKYKNDTCFLVRVSKSLQ